MTGVPIRESDWQRTVLDLAEIGGWRAHHALPATRNGRIATHQLGAPGFPDLVLVHPWRGLLFLELKSERGRVSEAQDAWITDLAAAGADVRVWRPSDLTEARHKLVGRYTPVRSSR